MSIKTLLNRFGPVWVRWPIVLAATVLSGLAISNARAAPPLPACISTIGTKATIIRIINAYTIETTSGLRIKLAGIDTVATPLGSTSKSALAKRARTLLTRLTLNKAVTLAYETDTPDRYARLTAHVFVPAKNNSAAIWVQAALMKKGLARAFPNTRQANCIRQLLEFEKDARQQKTGLWKHRFYQIAQAQDLKHLNRWLGRLRLVEGRIHSVTVRRSLSYINFSKDWKRDFTITVSARARKLFAQNGINIKELTGKNIRIRGWLDRHNGPTIQAYHVAQIEILKD